MNHNYTYKYWVDNLNLFSLPRVILLGCFYKPREIYYLNISKTAHKLINCLKLSTFLNLRSIQENDFINSHQELYVFYGAEREKSFLAMDIANRASIESHVLSKLDKRYNKSKIRFFLEKEISTDIMDFLTICNFINCFLSKDKRQETIRNIVIIKSNPWRSYLEFYKRDLVYKIYLYPDIKGLCESTFILFKIFLEIVANSICATLKKTGRIKNDIPTIAVLHAHGADLKKRADYFWFSGSSIDPQRILVYFKYHCWMPKKETIQLIESYNMRWLNLLPWKLKRAKLFFASPEFYRLPSSLYIKRLLGVSLELIKLLIYSLSGKIAVQFWEWANIANLLDRVIFYEAFFNIYNVKVHYGVYENGIEMMASNIAIELAGGLDLCHQWSNIDFTEIRMGKPHDIYFVWGPYHFKNFFCEDFYKVKYFIFTGYPYDDHFKECKEKGQNYRHRLWKSGARFIISFFDQTFPADWQKSRVDVEQLYRLLLRKVIEESDLGLITKPKRARNFWEKMPRLSVLVEEAEKTKRCIFLDEQIFSNEVAQASDLVIGFGVQSTPALESALSGIPAVACDLQDFSTYPLCLYPQGVNTIIFNKLERMNECIQRIKNKKDNDTKLGDYSFILTDIDPFRDGRASERIGNFIRRLLEEFDRGEDRKQAMENVVEKYRREWGADKVIDFRRQEKWNT